MQRKVGAGSVAVTREEVRGALSRTKSLSSEEEKALRMRYGAAEVPTAPLPRAAGGNAELQDELLVIEMQLHKALRMRMAQQSAARNVVAAPTPRASRAKEKIARALRKKK